MKFFAKRKAIECEINGTKCFLLEDDLVEGIEELARAFACGEIKKFSLTRDDSKVIITYEEIE